MSQQEIINWLFGISATVFGWYLNAIWGSIKDLQKADIALTDKVQAIELLVAGQYIKRDELQIFIDAVFKKLDKIEDKIDGKADKH